MYVLSDFSRHATTRANGFDGGLQDGFRTHCAGALTINSISLDAYLHKSNSILDYVEYRCVICGVG